MPPSPPIGMLDARRLQGSAMAVLGWQLAVFFSIYASGNWRTWVAVAWVIFTLAMVTTSPLALLQFGTIAAAYALAGGRVSTRNRARQTAPPERPPPVAVAVAAPRAISLFDRYGMWLGAMTAIGLVIAASVDSQPVREVIGSIAIGACFLSVGCMAIDLWRR